MNSVARYLNILPVNSDYVRRDLSEKIISLNCWNKCILKCPYCVGNMHVPDAQQAPNILDKMGIIKFNSQVEKMISAFGADGSRVKIVFAAADLLLWGGYEQLFDIAVKHNCKIMILSNLHLHKRLLAIFDKYDKTYISDNINFDVSYHLGTYLERSNTNYLRDMFVNRYIKLIADRGCAVNLVVPLAPKVLADKIFENEINKIKTYFAEGKFTVHFVELVYTLYGKRYPNSYTDRERMRVFELIHNHNSTRPIPLTIENLKYNQRFFLKGARCWFPSRYIHINMMGEIVNCDYGDILQRGKPVNIDTVTDFNTLLSPSPTFCKHDICGCSRWGNVYALNPVNVTIDKYIEFLLKINK